MKTILERIEFILEKTFTDEEISDTLKKNERLRKRWKMVIKKETETGKSYSEARTKAKKILGFSGR